ncbi:hypothetical protein BC628DRAFT_38819 [Trametes gibbosa]|nr:hypothetical protein BC628DRAFT_38819 [Trametes gibbosa]
MCRRFDDARLSTWPCSVRHRQIRFEIGRAPGRGHVGGSLNGAEPREAGCALTLSGLARRENWSAASSVVLWTRPGPSGNFDLRLRAVSPESPWNPTGVGVGVGGGAPALRVLALCPGCSTCERHTAQNCGCSAVASASAVQCCRSAERCSNALVDIGRCFGACTRVPRVSWKICWAVLEGFNLSSRRSMSTAVDAPQRQ